MSDSPDLAQLHEPYPLSPEQVDAYRRDGFVRVDGVLTGAALAAAREAVTAAVDAENRAGPPPESKGVYGRIFDQKVNLWRRHEAVARLTLSPRLAGIAAALEGRPVRLWHDQALFKAPHQNPKNPTPWHQDAPYWPHDDRAHSTSIWIALGDATVENGCMAFVPGSHRAGPLAPIPLEQGVDAGSRLFADAPAYKGVKARPEPLPAGSATFHNGLTFHYAGPNRSDHVRRAFVVIYMPDGVGYTGQPHVCTDGLGLPAGEPIDHEAFPKLT